MRAYDYTDNDYLFWMDGASWQSRLQWRRLIWILESTCEILQSQISNQQHFCGYDTGKWEIFEAFEHDVAWLGVDLEKCVRVSEYLRLWNLCGEDCHEGRPDATISISIGDFISLNTTWKNVHYRRCNAGSDDMWLMITHSDVETLGEQVNIT